MRILNFGNEQRKDKIKKGARIACFFIHDFTYMVFRPSKIWHQSETVTNSYNSYLGCLTEKKKREDYMN